MYAKNTRPSTKREVQKERSAKRDDRIARPGRAQTWERRELRAMRMCPRSGQIFIIMFLKFICNFFFSDFTLFSMFKKLLYIVRNKIKIY